METLVPGAEACCPRCGVVWLDAGEDGDHPCGECRVKAPPWTRARGAFAYGGALADVIARWKNGPAETLGPALAELMTAQAVTAGWSALAHDTVVVPVPGAFRKVRRRGFNPAGVLAKRMARTLGLPLRPTALKLTRKQKSTKHLGRAARLRRTRGLFAGSSRQLEQRFVLLVDDVMTTGATARAATRACLEAGATGVEVAVLARFAR